ncbi:MAG: phage holin family protein [Actinomycetota bacterium]|nr:phage holin family protein [Nocardioidaceae bacterium]MDQ3481108.1 phage holin family protein [Actinomycetota bacterium]
MSSTYEGGYQGSDYGAAGDGGATAAASPYPDVSDQSVGSLVGQLSTDLSKLMSQELALAKAEMKEEAKKAGVAGGMLAGAGLAGLMVAIFGTAALMYILDTQLPLPWAAVIVTVLWAIVGAVLFVMGRKKLQEVNPKPEQTVESLKEDKEWVKPQKN